MDEGGGGNDVSARAAARGRFWHQPLTRHGGHAGGRRVAEGLEVVAPLEEHDPTAGRHERQQLRRQVRVIPRREAQVSDRVRPMGIEARRDEEPRRMKGLRERRDHLVHTEERLKDVRREPLKVFGYAVGYQKRAGEKVGHVSVRIQKPIYLELKAYLSELAPKRSIETLMSEFSKVRFEAYAGVRDQMLHILREVNRRRSAGGLEKVPLVAIRMRRQSVKVFESEPEEAGDHDQEVSFAGVGTAKP